MFNYIYHRWKLRITKNANNVLIAEVHLTAHLLDFSVWNIFMFMMMLFYTYFIVSDANK